MEEVNKQIENLKLLFDLGFSDEWPSTSVRAHTFQNKKDKLLDVQRLVWVDSILNYALFYTLPYGHPASELWIESETDIKAAIYLVLGGYYRQAVATLRNWLELTLVGIYYNQRYQLSTSDYNLWKQGAKRSPHWPCLLEDLFETEGREMLVRADAEVKLRERLDNLHKELCAFVHLRGEEVRAWQQERDNVPRYVESAFDRWFSLAEQTSIGTSLVLIAEYPQDLRDYFQAHEQELSDLQEYLPRDVLGTRFFQRLLD